MHWGELYLYSEATKEEPEEHDPAAEATTDEGYPLQAEAVSTSDFYDAELTTNQHVQVAEPSSQLASHRYIQLIGQSHSNVIYSYLSSHMHICTLMLTIACKSKCYMNHVCILIEHDCVVD